MAVRQEVNTFESSVVLLVLEFAMNLNLALYVFYEAGVTNTSYEACLVVLQHLQQTH